MTIELYKKNKPLINSVLTGTAYLLFCWSLDFGDDSKMLFYVLMMFLPGLTFPITTTYYNITSDIESRVPPHIILSVLIYHGSVWILSAEGRVKYITILAGLSGSLFYSLVTKYFLKKDLTYFQIALTSILSGLAFVPIPSLIKGMDGAAIVFGLPVFIWTIINGQLMNVEYRNHYRQQRV